MDVRRRADDIEREIFDWYVATGKTVRDIASEMEVSVEHAQGAIDRQKDLYKALPGKFPPLPPPDATPEQRALALRRRVAALEQEVITLSGRCDMLIGTMAVRTTLHKDGDDDS